MRGLSFLHVRWKNISYPFTILGKVETDTTHEAHGTDCYDVSGLSEETGCFSDVDSL